MKLHIQNQLPRLAGNASKTQIAEVELIRKYSRDKNLQGEEEIKDTIEIKDII